MEPISNAPKQSVTPIVLGERIVAASPNKGKRHLANVMSVEKRNNIVRLFCEVNSLRPVPTAACDTCRATHSFVIMMARHA